MKSLLFLLITCGLALAADAPALRKQATELEKQGNWKEAYEVRVKLLREVNDAESGDDLDIALRSQRQLRELDQLDALLEELTVSKKDNPQFMEAAGNAYLNGHGHNGQLLDNKFKRGGYDGTGEYRQVVEQDRIRAMQCYMEALRTVEKGGVDEVVILKGLKGALLYNRTGSHYLWRLFVLTDISKAPDYSENIDTITSDGAPADAEGNPSLIDIPASWEAAKSDGERWRWILQEISRIDPNQANQNQLEWLRFCQQHYDVSTLAYYSWWSQPDVKERDGILQASTLKETETIARLASGVKRFTLREDYQFIPGLRDLMRKSKDTPSWQAGDQLVQIFLNRSQYPKAVETLKEVIELHGTQGDSRTNLLKQITGNWSRFNSTPTFYAEDPVAVSYTYRNAKETSLKLNKVNDELIMKDLIEYIESKPIELDYNKINFHYLGNRLIKEDRERYVGEEVRAWKQALNPDPDHSDTITDLDLGKLAPGCYLLESKLEDGNTSWITIWVRDLVMLQRAKGENGTFYLVNAKDGTPVVGEIEFFGFQTIYLDKPKGKRRFDIKTQSFRQKTDETGKLELKKANYENFQWYVIARAGERRAHLTNQHFNWYDHGDLTDYQAQNTIGITDRPVYRPGQIVHMKIWAGESRYDLADVSTYANKTADITIRDGRGEIVLEKHGIPTDAYGGATLDYKLPDEATLGAYNITVTGGVPHANFAFRVEEYKKPEYEVIVEAPKEPIALGEKFDVTVLAKYYHGAPVTEATVKIKVQRDFFNNRWFPDGPWDWLYGKGYWWCYSESYWYPGWDRWGCARPAPPWWQHGRMGAPELIIEQTSPIGPDGKVKVNIDSSIAKLVHGDQDHSYSITAEVIDASRRTIVGNGSVLAAREPYAVTVWLDRGYANVGDKVTGTYAARTLDGKKVEGKATAILYSSELNKAGEIEEKEIGKWTPEGENWTFTASKAGQYRVAVEFTDTKGRKQEGATIFSVRGADVKGNFRYNDLELIPDKKEYRPGDTVKLLVNVNQPDSRVWLFIRPFQGKLSETKIIHIKGKSQIVEIPLTLADMPNFFIEGVTVAKGQVHTVTREIVLPPEKRQLNVEVKPAKDKLKPREKTSLTVRITDHEGKPFKGSTAITIYDKSLEYISGGSNVGEIVPFFWDWKRHYYGNGMQHSQTLYGSHLQLPQTTFMQNLGMFGHMNGRSERGGGKQGMSMRSKNGAENEAFFSLAAEGRVAGAPMPAAESKMMAADSDEMSDAFAAGGGGEAGAAPQVMVRSEFADLLKWVGSIETNENGEATIDLEMPDNLTTWKIKTWAMGKGTRVGEGSAEIVTSKDLIIRLQAPRFFVEKDEATLSAVVHNYHKEAKEVTISLELDEKNLTAAENKTHKVSIPSMGETRIDWSTKAIAEGETTIRMKAIAADDSDAMEMKFPVYVHGMLKTDSFSRSIAPDGTVTSIDFNIPKERRPNQSKLTLNYSPSVASAMIDALPYLSSYPYGCTEQTLNRFVPTTVVHHILKDLGHDLGAIKDKKINLNPQQLGDPKERAAQWQPKHPYWNPVWDEKEVAKMEAAGIAKLRDQQNPDGGWGWFSAYGHQSYAHTTAVVMHGLLLARDNGAKVPNDMIERGLQWLAQHEATEVERIASYGKRKENTKQKADSTDALVRRILGEGSKDHPQMLEFLYRDKVDLPIYAKALVGLEFHRTKDTAKRDDLIRNIRQFLKTDAENQTAYLDLKNGNYWWYWYGSEFEAQAWFLKLLAAAEPNSPDTRGLVKYLINNRRNGTYWHSTRDTAYCIEAIGDFLKATKEGDPNLTVEVLLDGKTLKTVEINKDNLFTFDNTAIVAGDILTSGKHTVEIRKKGTGPLYANAYVEYFTLEDFITKAGLEVKVDRTYHKLVPDQKVIDAVNSSGQAVDQKRSIYQRIELKSGDEIKSGDLIEVTLGIDSKNDYEYLVFEDWKAAGMEPVDVQSGYNPNGLGAYMELRDEKVSLFVQFLPRGRHNLSYRLRAEIPGKFSALPTHAEAMYAPELRANSDEMKFIIKD